MPTIKQKKAFDNLLENVRKTTPDTKEQILVKSGYKKISKQPSRIFESKGFKELLAQIDDNVILNKFYEILQDTDKRSSISAGIELLKLKDRYPDKKLRLGRLEEEIKELTE